MPREILNMCWRNLPPRERAKVLAGSTKTTWWFGAGASHHYAENVGGVPVPLANGFFPAFHSLPTSGGLHAHVGPFISFLEHYRGIPPQEVAFWGENIEDFMTSIEQELDELKSRRSTKKRSPEELAKIFSLSSVFSNMTFIMANVVNEAQNGPSESIYRYILDFCGPDDAFITFNWDTLLDRALVDSGGWTPNVGYGLQFTSALDSTWKPQVEGERAFETNWKLLKLHGSTNWLVPYSFVHLKTLEQTSLVPGSDRIFLYWQATLPYATHKSRWRGGYAPTTYCYYPPNIPADLFSAKQLAAPPGKMIIRAALKHIFSPGDEANAEGVVSSPLLITPVRQKRYDVYQPAIHSLWKQAAQSLRSSNQIVIVGYSFPRTDTRALELLGDTLASKRGEIAVTIVSPDATDIFRRIREVLKDARSVKTYDLKFEEYIEVLASEIPSRMKKAARSKRNKGVRDWINRMYLMNRIAQERYRASRNSGA